MGRVSWSLEMLPWHLSGPEGPWPGSPLSVFSQHTQTLVPCFLGASPCPGWASGGSRRATVPLCASCLPAVSVLKLRAPLLSVEAHFLPKSAGPCVGCPNVRHGCDRAMPRWPELRGGKECFLPLVLMKRN